MNFPGAKLVESDITDVSPKAFSRLTGVVPGEIDVVFGGPPCQTFSTIGVPKIRSVKGSHREVLSDPRNYLFANFYEYVRYFQPRVFVMENVPAMKTRYGGKLFARLMDLVSDLPYRTHVAVLNSVEYGVPQIRRRLFVVGTATGCEFRFPKPTHASPGVGQQPSLPGVLGRLRDARTVHDAISDLPAITDGCRHDELPYARHDALTDYQLEMRNPSGTVRNNICRVSNDRAKRLFPHMRPGARYMDLLPEVRKILPFREDIFFDRLKRLDPAQPSWTVLAHIGMDGYMYIHPWENRTLSVREAARIQSFPDRFVFFGNMREQYVQVGNAVPPMLARALAGSVKEALTS